MMVREFPYTSCMTNRTLLEPAARYSPTSTVTFPCITFSVSRTEPFTDTFSVPFPVGVSSIVDDQFTESGQAAPRRIVVDNHSIPFVMAIVASLPEPPPLPPPPPMPLIPPSPMTTPSEVKYKVPFSTNHPLTIPESEVWTCSRSALIPSTSSFRELMSLPMVSIFEYTLANLA